MNREMIIPFVLRCPNCGREHVDEGEWETRPHRTHLCLECRIEFEVTLRGVKSAFRENIIAHLKREINGGESLLGMYEAVAPSSKSEHAQVWFKTNAYRDMLARINEGEFDGVKSAPATELQQTNEKEPQHNP